MSRLTRIALLAATAAALARGLRRPGSSRAGGYQVRPYPRLRRLVEDNFYLSRLRHTMHGFAEVDVTRPRQLIREIETQSGERPSFTAFLALCIAQAVEENRSVQAMRDWRGRLIVFDDVDVLVTIEIPADGGTFPLAHPLRDANRRSLRDLHNEIRRIQHTPRQSASLRSPLLRWFYLVPDPVRHLGERLVLRNPGWFRSFGGTVSLTAVGMFGTGSFWGLGTPIHTLTITVGGIASKPGVVDGRIEPREYLNLTVSFDHAIVDGAPAARFGRRLAELIEGAFGLDTWAG